MRAELVRVLLDDGLAMDVTAQSHAVIGHLLGTDRRPACKSATRTTTAAPPEWTASTPTGEVIAALTVGTHRPVGGSAWLWAREELTGLVDVLVIDEAGQFSLASAVVDADDVGDQAGLGAARELEHGACRGSSQVTLLAVAGRCRARPVLRAAGPIPVVFLPEAAGRRGAVGSSRWPVKMLPL
jgi:hypothetical protein